MDLFISATHAVDKAAAAMVDAVRAVQTEGQIERHDAVELTHDIVANQATRAETLAQGGFVERILGQAQSDVTAEPAQPSGNRADNGMETGSVQTQARTQQVVPEPIRRQDAALPAAAFGRSEFAVPAALLLPVTLTGLQVERAEGWPLPQPAYVATPLPRSDTPRVEGRESSADDDAPAPTAEQEDSDASDEAGSAEKEVEAPELEAASDDDWCEALTLALREALSAKVPPRPLLAAAEQWQRGRCVVLACPQGSDPAGPAWAFVLWPRKFALTRRRSDGSVAPLALHGLRVEARLRWSALPRQANWCHVRVVKEHHPRRGRQLVPPGDPAGAPAACEVQLGPVLARSLRWCEVCVRINAAQRFWAALGAQWSVHVVVCSQPLTTSRMRVKEDA